MKRRQQLSLFDLERSREARDEGIAKVNDHNDTWRQQAQELFASAFRPGEEVIGEQIRDRLLGHGLPLPKHSNAWGGLTSGLVKAGRLRDTGRSGQMTALSSHARRSPLWVVG
jgi:hypothetical protein